MNGAEMGWGQWTNCAKDPKVSPYEDWIKTIGGDIYTTRGDPADPKDPDRLVQIAGLPPFIGRDAHDRTECETGEEAAESDLKKVLAEANVDPEIPAFAKNEVFCSDNDWIAYPGGTEIPENAVVVGVIDRGIALGHRSTRLADGKTRFLAAWQQIADRSGIPAGDPVSGNLPFGVGFLGPQIQDALDASQNLPGSRFQIDEDQFNRLMRHEDYLHIRGHRELGRRIAHGTHVLDIAGGTDPTHRPLSAGEKKDAEEFARRVRLIAVNLPERSIVGLASQNLTLFVILGILWTVRYADAIWNANFVGILKSQKSFPVVINLSFATQAGSRDGYDDISRFMRRLNAKRIADGKHPVHLVVPAGNDNLSRGHAHKCMKPGVPMTLDWRLQPGDQSANYVEIWWSSTSEGEENCDLAISVESPAGETVGLARGQPGQCIDLPNIARIYCEQRPPRRVGKHPPLKLLRYVICTTPTFLQKIIKQELEAPAGLWRIKLVNQGASDFYISMDVQTDQSEQPESGATRRSYFDDCRYRRFDGAGRRYDTYNYPDWPDRRKFPPCPERKDFDNNYDGDSNRPNPGPIRRHGTMNALAGARRSEPSTAPPGAIIVGGFRGTDGKPVPYSSTGLGFFLYENKDYSSLAAPACAFMTDGGPAHPGYIASGARDGSSVSMRGTSFATAQATRFAAGLLLGQTKNPCFLLPEKMEDLARAAETQANNDGKYRFPGFPDPEKSGRGRLRIESWSNAQRYNSD